MNELRNDRNRRSGAIGVQRRGPTQQAKRQDYSLANSRRQYERYIELAKEAARAGDRVEMENCYQHAEHHFRTMRDPDQR